MLDIEGKACQPGNRAAWPGILPNAEYGNSPGNAVGGGIQGGDGHANPLGTAMLQMHRPGPENGMSAPHDLSQQRGNLWAMVKREEVLQRTGEDIAGEVAGEAMRAGVPQTQRPIRSNANDALRQGISERGEKVK